MAVYGMLRYVTRFDFMLIRSLLFVCNQIKLEFYIFFGENEQDLGFHANSFEENFLDSNRFSRFYNTKDYRCQLDSV